jgi:hypothetical protein
MTQEEQLVYNFLANKIGATAPNDERCIPYFFFLVYNIDTKEVVSKVWRARDGFEWIKTRNGTLAEHYRQIDLDRGLFGVSLDLNTGDHLEEYKIDGYDLIKNNIRDPTPTGLTTDIKVFEDLPAEYRTQLADFPYKEKIIYWANKPYGRIIGVTKNF